MKIINVRSPYTVIVDEAGQSSARLELFIWNNGNSEPTIPTYNLSKKIPSLSQTECDFNISPYARPFISFQYPIIESTPQEEDNNNWCFMRVKSYSVIGKTETLISNLVYICTKGFTNYLGGYNQGVILSPSETLSSYNKSIYYDRSKPYPYVNFFIDYVSAYDNIYIEYTNSIGEQDAIIFLESTDTNKVYNFKIPITTSTSYFNNENTFEILSSELGTLYKSSCKQFCEPVYSPKICSYINSKGGWEFLTFFKAQTRTIDIQSSSASFFPKQLDYSIYDGQTQAFNINGSEKITLHTGYVPESYAQSIKELLLSEKVLLDNVPVKVNTKSIESKTQLKSNNISYEIEFEYAFDLINNVT